MRRNEIGTSKINYLCIFQDPKYNIFANDSHRAWSETLALSAATSPPIKSHSPIGYWNLPAIMIAHFRFHTSTLYPTSISSCRIYVMNSFLMGGKEISSRRCKCKWKPNCSNASELQTLQRTNITHIFILYIFEMLKVQNHECHESWKIQGVPEKSLL